MVDDARTNDDGRRLGEVAEYSRLQKLTAESGLCLVEDRGVDVVPLFSLQIEVAWMEAELDGIQIVVDTVGAKNQHIPLIQLGHRDVEVAEVWLSRVKVRADAPAAVLGVEHGGATGLGDVGDVPGHLGPDERLAVMDHQGVGQEVLVHGNAQIVDRQWRWEWNRVGQQGNQEAVGLKVKLGTDEPREPLLIYFIKRMMMCWGCGQSDMIVVVLLGINKTQVIYKGVQVTGVSQQRGELLGLRVGHEEMSDDGEEEVILQRIPHPKQRGELNPASARLEGLQEIEGLAREAQQGGFVFPAHEARPPGAVVERWLGDPWLKGVPSSDEAEIGIDGGKIVGREKWMMRRRMKMRKRKMMRMR